MLTRSLFALALLSKPLFVCNPQPIPAMWGETDTSDTTDSSGSTDPTTTDPTTTDSTSMTTSVPPTCGNGEVEDGEECDDGNQTAEDACPNTCKMAVCGDDIVWTDMEECDDANQDDTDACVACKDAFCGDGKVRAGVEECDDGNQIDTDACTSACKLPVCGDGVVAATEECDDGNQIDTDACVACKNAVCGDGKVLADQEECDDGNTGKGDGCSEICTHEYLMFVTKDSYPADMGGVVGADALCQAAAQGKLTGTYVAWISAEGDAASTDIPAGKPLIRRDGMPIVATAEDLFKGGATMLLNPIDRDQEGNPVTGYAWTGTNQLGQPTLTDCSGWSQAANGGATVGSVASTGLEWTNTIPEPLTQLQCSSNNHVYCFRKAEP